MATEHPHRQSLHLLAAGAHDMLEDGEVAIRRNPSLSLESPEFGRLVKAYASPRASIFI